MSSGRQLVAVRCIVGLGLIVLTACESISRARQVEACEATLRDAPVRLLLGTDGTRELCSCTVDQVAERFPDAGRRWLEYQREVEARLESRGMLGIAMDTAWTGTRGREIAEFGAAHLEILGTCLADQLTPKPSPAEQSRNGS